MARVLVTSDDGSFAIPVVSGTDAEGDEWTTAECPVHGPIEADHSYFEDMVQATELHVDQRH